jgi:hypothetical protein
MARVQVVADSGLVIVDISQDGDTGWTTGRCRSCGAVISDRGHFEDTVQAAEVHADQPH